MIGKTFSVKRNTEVVRNKKAGRTIVRFGMFVIVLVGDSGKGNRYQIITDTRRNHTAGKVDVDSIVPQCRLPFQKYAVSELGNIILAPTDRLCPIY